MKALTPLSDFEHGFVTASSAGRSVGRSQPGPKDALAMRASKRWIARS